MFALKDQIRMDHAACGARDVTQEGNVANTWRVQAATASTFKN